MVRSKVRRQEGIIEPVRTNVNTCTYYWFSAKSIGPIGLFFHHMKGNSARGYLLVQVTGPFTPFKVYVVPIGQCCSIFSMIFLPIWQEHPKLLGQQHSVWPSRTFFSVRLLHFINSIPLFAFSSRNHRNHRALKMETKRRRVNTPKCMMIEVRRLNHLMVYFA